MNKTWGFRVSKEIGMVIFHTFLKLNVNNHLNQDSEKRHPTSPLLSPQKERKYILQRTRLLLGFSSCSMLIR